MSRIGIGCLGLGLLLSVAACDREVPLEGERFGTRVPLAQSLSGEVAADTVTANEARPISLTAPVNLDAWPQRAGNARNISPHATLGPAPVEIWAADIGQGNVRRARITADPVAADGRIFTLDSEAQVVAHDTNGAPLWTADLTPGFERGSPVSGGGLAVSGGTLFATTGFGELIAMDVATGAVAWRQRLDASITTPTVASNAVYVVSRDNQAWSLDPETGRIRWQLPAAPSATVLSGGAAPAVNDRIAVFPFGSGELVAVLRLSGVRIWGTTVAGSRPGVAYNNLNDISGDPVLTGDRVYAGNQSGRVVALNATSGNRIWTAQDGSYSPLLPAGDSLFFVSDRNELIRLDADTGERIWGVELPLYVRQRERRREAVFTHFGPIMAGGRLVMASGDDLIRFFDPTSGAILSTLPIRDGAAANPIVVNNTLYVVSGDGRLHAYR